MEAIMKTDFQNLKHKYALKNGTETIVRHADYSDIPDILKLYRSIKITPSNITTKLMQEHRDSFKNKGGFFQTLSRNDLEKLIHHEEYVFLVSSFEEPGGNERITSCLYCRLNTKEFSNMNWNLGDSGLSDQKRRGLISAIERDKVCTAVEHAILPAYQGRGTAYPVIYEMYKKLYEAGMQFIMLQIFSITGIHYKGSYYTVNLPNEKSIILNKKLGGIVIGTNTIPLKKVGEREIEIQSHVFVLDLANVVDILHNKVKDFIIS